jgi:gliding motility-associated-like protein
LTTYETYAVNDEIKFNNLNTGGEIDVLWDFGDGSTSSELHPSYTYTELGTYRVTLTITYDYGCSGSYYEDIEIIKGYNIMVPNGFTPNGDGVNDYFKPVYIGVVTTLIEVYDTWGSMVYSEEGNILKGWNGLIKNTEAENGNYIYKIIAKPFNTNIPIVLNGAFTLMK